MKRLIVLLLLLASMGAASAQNWAPFPLDETSEWRVDKGHLTNGCWVTENLVYYVAGDTVINTETYTIINYEGTVWSQTAESQNPACNVWPPVPVSGIRGTIRAENGIYYEPGWNHEQILYDLTQEVGDTVAGPTGGEVYIVDSVDVVNVGGAQRKRLWFMSTGGLQSLVDGVGSTHGLFEEMFFFEFYNQLVCYGENGIPLYPEGSNCDFTVDVVSHSQEDDLLVSPNPSSGIFRMETSQASSYRVYDLFGRIITQGQLNGTSELDLTSQPNGIYLISVETENGISTAKLVKH
jgi:hypothetical protein